MKHIATVPAALMRAAMLYQAKNDVRYYLCGVMIDAENIIATDGHTMFISPYQTDKRPEKPVIVAISGKIPKNAVNLQLLFDEENDIGMARCVGPVPTISQGQDGDVTEADAKPISIFDKMGHPLTLPFHVIDGRYPDYQRVIPKGDPVPTSTIGVDVVLMAKAAAAMKELGYRFTAAALSLYGPTNSMVLETCPGNPNQNIKIIVMPCRM